MAEETIPDGLILTRVLLDLMERVTALEQNRAPNLSPVIRLEDEDEESSGFFKKPVGALRTAVTKHAQAEMVRLYKRDVSINRIARDMDVSAQTVLNHLRRMGVAPPPKQRRNFSIADKKESA